MGIKPNIEIMPPQRLSIPQRAHALTVTMPPAMVTVPAPFETPATIWGARRQAQRYRALADIARAQTEFLQEREKACNAYVETARAAHKVAELPEICESDTQRRRIERERDLVRALKELEEERYGFCATQLEVHKLRKQSTNKALPNNGAAIDALMKAKIELEKVGEDTTELDQTIMILQRV